MLREEKADSCTDAGAKVIDYFELELPGHWKRRRTFIVCEFKKRYSMFYCSTGTSSDRTSQFEGTYFQTVGILRERDIPTPLVEKTHDSSSVTDVNTTEILEKNVIFH